MINSKCKARFHAFHSVSERICAADVDMGRRRFRFVCAYFPHGGYPDAAVEELYSQLTSLCNKGKKLKRTVVVCGDWNAVVGGRVHGDDPRTVGLHGIGDRNSRGEWLAGWASSNEMCIANTMFRKQFDQQWIHKNADRNRQIDYCLCEWRLRRQLENAEACEDISVGADHRAVRIEIAEENVQGLADQDYTTVSQTKAMGLAGYRCAPIPE